MARKRSAFSQKTGGQVFKPRTFEKLRIDHDAKLTPRLRRKLSAGPNLRFELEKRAFPENVVNGTILERIVAKQVNDRGYSFQFQYDVNLGGLNSARLDIAVFGTGISEPLGIEPHGAIWHTDREADRQRDLALRMRGITVVYLWEDDLVGTEDRMNKVIDDALRGVGRPGPIEMPAPISF